MADRKLYHLINGEFVYDGMPSMRIPTYEEVHAHIEILTNVGFFDDPIAESVPAWDGLSNGKRTTEKQVSLYDAMMAELSGEKSARAEKFRKTHDMRKKSKDDTPADRRKNRINRMYRLYGTMFEDGNNWYWERGREGQKKSTEPDADIFHNLKERSAEMDALRDYITNPLERKVGYNTVQRIMYNADKRMREIRAEIVEKYGADAVDCYDDSYVVRCGDGGFQFPYPDEYYNDKATWAGYEYMIRKYGMEYANKYAKGT